MRRPAYPVWLPAIPTEVPGVLEGLEGVAGIGVEVVGVDELLEAGVEAGLTPGGDVRD